DRALGQEALGAARRSAAPLERVGVFVPAPAANLQRAVDDLPLARGVPLLRGGGFEPDVVTAAVGQLAGQFPDRVHRKGGRRQAGYLVSDRFVFANRNAPLRAGVRP